MPKKRLYNKNKNVSPKIYFAPPTLKPGYGQWRSQPKNWGGQNVWF